MKDQIAAEVQRQIALENAEAQGAARNVEPDPASSGIQRMLTDNVSHVFVVGRELDLVDGAGAECRVTEGDALQLAAPPAAGCSRSDVHGTRQQRRRGVRGRWTGERCHGGSAGHAEPHARDDRPGDGRTENEARPGRFAALPASANAEPVKTEMAAGAPPPDPNAAAEINQQSQLADAAEKEAQTETAAQGGPNAASPAPAPAPEPAGPPPSVSLGQTIEEITAALGQPSNT